MATKQPHENMLNMINLQTWVTLVSFIIEILLSNLSYRARFRLHDNLPNAIIHNANILNAMAIKYVKT